MKNARPATRKKTAPAAPPNEKRTVFLSAIGGGATVLAILALVWFLASPSRKTSAETSAPIPSTTPASAPVATAPQGDFPRITIDQYRALLEQGQAITIDVRDADSYTSAHIPDSLHIPLSFLAGELPYLPKDKTIVTYCSCPAEETSGAATTLLVQNGFRSSALLGGFDTWQAAGLPVRSGLEKKQP